jgi:hypothetical protein
VEARLVGAIQREARLAHLDDEQRGGRQRPGRAAERSGDDGDEG